MTLLDEIMAKADPADIAAHEHGKIAAAVNVGRTKIVSKLVTERGVRAALGPVVGSKFVLLLKQLAALVETGGAPPEWLTAVLSVMKVPADDHIYYLDTLGCGWDWIRQDPGVDVGSATVRGMLDLIAAGNPGLATGIAALKALATAPDPVTNEMVIAALAGG